MLSLSYLLAVVFLQLSNMIISISYSHFKVIGDTAATSLYRAARSKGMLAHLLRKAGIVTHDVLAASEPDVIGDNMGITLCVCYPSISIWIALSSSSSACRNFFG